jgi:hypothetical protein
MTTYSSGLGINKDGELGNGSIPPIVMFAIIGSILAEQCSRSPGDNARVIPVYS